MATTRVYILARELGVKSSAIVKKCQDEGLDVRNHMATISAGLAATIREWFSEGENVTTVETADKVDLEEVRVKRKPAHMEGALGTLESDGEEAETAVLEPQEFPTESIVEQEPEPVIAEEPPVVAPQPVEAAEVEPEPVAPAAPEISPVPAVAAEAPREAPPMVEVKAPEPPKPVEKPKPPIEVLPAGPMLHKPKPAKLSGPQVVRVEAPEPMDRPRSRFKPRYDAPVTQPLMYKGKDAAAAGRPAKPAVGSEVADKKGVKSRSTKDRTHGRRKEEVEEEAKKAKLHKNWRQRDIEERQARLTAAGGEGLRLRPTRRIASKSSRESAVSVRPKSVVMGEPILVKDLSAALAVKATDIIAKLMKQGVMATANQSIRSDVAELVALEFDTELIVERKATLEEEIQKEFDQRERANLKRRPIVAAMLGHVDHGKTSLLDRIRKTHVAAGEAGGITQHIGAYQVVHDGKQITFVDTPGHEAFTAMRARGAKITDIATIVVAADDGVMPQTIEAIDHAKAAEVPIVIAVNKIDKPDANPDKVKQQLTEFEIVPEEWGGENVFVEVSAKKRQGLDNFLEMLLLVAEVADLKANPEAPASGFIIESRVDAGRGVVVSMLVSRGTLHVGDGIVAGMAAGRVRAMRDFRGEPLEAAGPSTPVEIIGFDQLPDAGELCRVVEDEKTARALAQKRANRVKAEQLAQQRAVTLDDLYARIAAGRVEELSLIVKADVQGSLEALQDALTQIQHEEVKIRIIRSGVGAVTESDVMLAAASQAIIIGFNVRPNVSAAALAEQEGVDIRTYRVIYKATEEVRAALMGMLKPQYAEQVVGSAEVRQTFRASRVGTIAGSFVTDGVIPRNAGVRLVRDGTVVFEGRIGSLKRFQEDVREVQSGFECGILLDGFNDIKEGDVIEAYESREVAREA